MTLFLDMDGVLADFDQHHENLFGYRPDRSRPGWAANWKGITDKGDFYAGIPPMQDLSRLLDYVWPLEPVVLTGLPQSNSEAVDRQKRAWVAEHLGCCVPVITCRSKDKAQHCWDGDILVDDWEKYKQLWLDAGGMWVTHTSAEDTINELKRLGL